MSFTEKEKLVSTLLFDEDFVKSLFKGVREILEKKIEQSKTSNIKHDGKTTAVSIDDSINLIYKAFLKHVDGYNENELTMSDFFEILFRQNTLQSKQIAKLLRLSDMKIGDDKLCFLIPLYIVSLKINQTANFDPSLVLMNYQSSNCISSP